MTQAIEYAMTHRAGLQGAELCRRPAGVLEIAQRVQRWGAGRDTCQSCSAHSAVRFAGGRALCGRCHGTRRERLGLTVRRGVAAPASAVRQATAAGARLEGYAVVFDSRSVDLGGFYEFIRPSAADRMVRERPDLRALWNHGSSETIGRTSAGTLATEKRAAGIWVRIVPPRWADRHVESIERRDIQGMSFGFVALEDDWWFQDGAAHREVLDMSLIEVSPVSFPAYAATSIHVARSARTTPTGGGSTVAAAAERARRLKAQQTSERLRLAR